MGGGGGSWLDCEGESGSAEGVIILGVGGPRGLDCTTLSTRDVGLLPLLDVFKVSAALVGDSSPSSMDVAIDARRLVRLNGR